MISDSEELKDTVLWWLLPLRNQGLMIYRIMMAMFFAAIGSLFIIRVDLTVSASGVIRPIMERTEIRSPASGLIDSVFFREGDTVLKNDILLVLRDPSLIEKWQMNESEIARCSDFIHDLELLCSSPVFPGGWVPLLKSSQYKQKMTQFSSRIREQKVLLSKAKYDRTLTEKPAEEKIKTPKVRYEVQEQKIMAAFETFRQQQSTVWKNDLVKYKVELKQWITRRQELNQLVETNRIRATISGCLQKNNGFYLGNFLQAGERICAINPGDELMGECYVSTKDIGLLRTGQPARLQVDAFNYNYFGVVTASIYAIDNDITLLDKTPVFKVQCRLRERALILTNGFSGELKKGMRFQARFIEANRSLWQLLSDDLNDWLNPARQSIPPNP